ncbi:hypothetical protein [Rhizobium sp. NRK18]|uniref:hypothetical protein n=1 Tax=Rhizobium sp. NRK18 TaxID=2964667 RepID=UPI0021C4325D|nr:hypothetical protein [Rhizobium sp. NRK18]MCQ2005696.1 hypothetical protein [Rhizobium sp. NRK18]
MDDTTGLDILGVRAIDQGMESDLVNGITTVSARGRYFSILPWAINQFYNMTLEAGEPFDQGALTAFLTRVEFLIIAASQADPTGGAGGAILGSDYFAPQMKLLKSGTAVSLPLSKSSRILNIYYNPCKSVGFIGNAPNGSPVPYQITERGRAIWQARQGRLEGSPLLDLLFRGGDVDHAIAEAAVSEFSLGALVPESDEARLLRDAFQTAYPSAASAREMIEHRYRLLRGTQAWIASWADSGRASADQLLALNLQQVSAGQRRDTASLAWASYEWRRRQHFALELLLNAVCGVLGALGGAGTVDDVVRATREEWNLNERLKDLWPAASDAWSSTAIVARGSVPPDLFAGKALRFRSVDELSPPEKLMASFAILSALQDQTRSFRGTLAAHANSISDLALSLIISVGDQPFAEFLSELAERCAVTPHLQVTLRKMSAGQKCSLRFFPDGNVLRLTANQTNAGFSGTRLYNTINVLSDIGILTRNVDGSLATREAAA